MLNTNVEYVIDKEQTKAVHRNEFSRFNQLHTEDKIQPEKTASAWFRFILKKPDFTFHEILENFDDTFFSLLSASLSNTFEFSYSLKPPNEEVANRVSAALGHFFGSHVEEPVLKDCHSTRAFETSLSSNL